MDNNQKRILIVEDEALIAEDIAEICQADSLSICKIAYNAGQALLEIESFKPDLILLDINIDDDIDGIMIAEKIEEDYNIPYLFISSYSDPNTLSRVKQLHPHGYIVKPFNRQQLMTTIDLAITNVVKNNKQISFDSQINNLNISLTKKENIILRLMLDGLKYKEISTRIFLSENTIKYHVKNIYSKFDVHTRSELFATFSKR